MAVSGSGPSNQPSNQSEGAKSPGWYQLGNNPNRQSYWTGSQWSGQRRWSAGIGWQDIDQSSAAPSQRSPRRAPAKVRKLWGAGIVAILVLGGAAGTTAALASGSSKHPGTNTRTRVTTIGTLAAAPTTTTTTTPPPALRPTPATSSGRPPSAPVRTVAPPSVTPTTSAPVIPVASAPVTSAPPPTVTTIPAPPVCTVTTAAHTYPPGGQAAYTLTSTVPSQPYVLQVSGGNGASDTYGGFTDSQGNAVGTFPVPNIDQLWYVGVTFDQAGITCNTTFYSANS